MPCFEYNLGLLVFLIATMMSSCGTTMVGATSTTPTVDLVDPTSTLQKLGSSKSTDTEIVFSDVDGTLVHYPESIPERSDKILALPPSSTGMRAIISQETLRQCREIRYQHGRRLVLVSGMRTTTLLNRLPYLPKADAYCSEAGGRIFYPVPVEIQSVVRIEPVPFEGASPEDLAPFGLQEDLEWRQSMEKAAGVDGFVGQELGQLLQASSKAAPTTIPVMSRKGPLWDYARLLEQQGLVLDTKGYATSFRVTARQQLESSLDTFRALQQNEFPCPPGVTTRTNLGSMDFYPTISGKKNCCEYLAMKLAAVKLDEQAVCMGDDDNDIEMALACRHAFIPTVTSETMADTIAQHASHFTAVRGVQHTLATEMALDKVLQRLKEEDDEATS